MTNQFLFAVALLIVVIGLLAISAILLRIAFRLLVARDEDYRAAKTLSPTSILRVLAGDVNAYRNDMRDYAVSAGIAKDLKTGRLKAQGRISKELIDPLI